MDNIDNITLKNSSPSEESPFTDATLRTEIERLQRAFQQQSDYINGLRRQMRVMGFSLVLVLAGSILLPIASPALAQGYGGTLQHILIRLAALETKTASMS